jgi:Phage integrase, N-terminal SAM-like domain
MSESVKQQLIQDLQMAGLAPSSQKRYLDIIVRFVNRTRTRPQDATEAQVAEYLRGLISQGQCQGTIAPVRAALQFVFENTLGRQWDLFKKRSPPSVASVFPRPPATASAGASSRRSTRPHAVFAWP